MFSKLQSKIQNGKCKKLQHRKLKMRNAYIARWQGIVEQVNEIYFHPSLVVWVISQSAPPLLTSGQVTGGSLADESSRKEPEI